MPQNRAEKQSEAFSRLGLTVAVAIADDIACSMFGVWLAGRWGLMANRETRHGLTAVVKD